MESGIVTIVVIIAVSIAIVILVLIVVAGYVSRWIHNNRIKAHIKSAQDELAEAQREIDQIKHSMILMKQRQREIDKLCISSEAQVAKALHKVRQLIKVTREKILEGPYPPLPSDRLMVKQRELEAIEAELTDAETETIYLHKQSKELTSILNKHVKEPKLSVRKRLKHKLTRHKHKNEVDYGGREVEKSSWLHTSYDTSDSYGTDVSELTDTISRPLHDLCDTNTGIDNELRQESKTPAETEERLIEAASIELSGSYDHPRVPAVALVKETAV